MRMYLLIALVWLLLAVLAFLYPVGWTILDTGWSIAWVLLFLVVWNVIRWWLTLPASSGPGPAGNDEKVTR
jgi:hypothetical protein